MKSSYKLTIDYVLSSTMILVIFLVMSLLIFSCQKESEKIIGEKRLKVVTSLFPLYDFAKNIGRQKADVTLLLPPGVEPHSFEPRPGDVLKIHNADIFIYTGKDMEPWVEDILKSLGSQRPLIIDASKNIVFSEENFGREHKPEPWKRDPHIWLEFSNAQKIVDNILEGYQYKAKIYNDYFIKNAKAYQTRLTELDRKFSDSLASCKKDLIIHGGHSAFGYLARRYNIKYLPAYKGFSPDTEPTPKNLIELSKKLREYDIKYIFYEELIKPRVSGAIARETKVNLLMLHGAHNITKDELDRGITFLDLMEKNLENLKIGLECR